MDIESVTVSSESNEPSHNFPVDSYQEFLNAKFKNNNKTNSASLNHQTRPHYNNNNNNREYNHNYNQSSNNNNNNASAYAPLHINPFPATGPPANNYNNHAQVTHSPMSAHPVMYNNSVANNTAFQSVMLHNIFNRMLANNLVPTASLMSPPLTAMAVAAAAAALVSPQMSAPNNYINREPTQQMSSATFQDTMLHQPYSSSSQQQQQQQPQQHHQHPENNYNQNGNMNMQKRNNFNYKNFANKNKSKPFNNGNNKLNMNKVSRKQQRRQLFSQNKSKNIVIQSTFDDTTACLQAADSTNGSSGAVAVDNRSKTPVIPVFDLDERFLDRESGNSDIDYRSLNPGAAVANNEHITHDLPSETNQVELDTVQDKLNEINKEVEAFNKETAAEKASMEFFYE
jgi:hypothetical protein